LDDNDNQDKKLDIMCVLHMNINCVSKIVITITINF